MRITVNNLVKNYRNRIVLNVDDLTLEKGKIYAILGLNGSGKTTLIECIAGLIDYDQGDIQYQGYKDVSAARRDISICTQKPYLFNKTVYKNIISGLEFRKTSKEIIKEKSDRYLKYFSIKTLMDKNARELSVGEGAKTALLRTAVPETAVTFLDEPTASMDIESTLQAEELIRAMNKGNRTVVIVTHDIFQAKRLANEVIFMDKGEVMEKGSAIQVFNNPANIYLKKILAI